MKIKESQLRKIIKEEILREIGELSTQDAGQALATIDDAVRQLVANANSEGNSKVAGEISRVSEEFLEFIKNSGMMATQDLGMSGMMDKKKKFVPGK